MAKGRGRSPGTISGKSHLMHDRTVPVSVQSSDHKRLPAVFYKTAAGNEPVREWLKNDVGDKDRKKIGTNIRKVEIGWPIGMPTCSPLLNSLWEVRTSLKDRIARVIFFVYEDSMVLLHGFIKKDQQTPQVDIDLAVSRKRDVEGRK